MKPGANCRQTGMCTQTVFTISAVKCPCPRWFPDNTPTGTYDWDHPYEPSCPIDMVGDTRPRDYGTEIKYTCPAGYAFDTSALDVPLPESREMTFTCEKWNDWDPPIQPVCVRKLMI